MGTSVVAVATAAIGWPLWISRALLAVASIVAVLVIAVTTVRWVKHSDLALADLRHPVKGGMSATLAGGLLAWAVAIGRVGAGWLPDDLITISVAVLTATGAIVALIIGWEFMANLFTSQGTPTEQISGAWFIPPVVTIIIPLALVPLALELPDLSADLLALGWAFLGMGAVLYFVVTAVLFLRTVSHPLPPDALAPTLFIGMGPAGLMGLDMVRLAQASGNPALVDAMVPLATMMWGFGFWWMVAAALVIRRGYGSLPFSLSWWGFVFPFGAWTVATILLAENWDSGLFTILAWVSAAVLSLMWVVTAARTLAGIRRGTIWGH
jgi:C4-dicarboxylate transporter/malic acid transport protein